jgi:hypothetical protein
LRITVPDQQQYPVVVTGFINKFLEFRGVVYGLPVNLQDDSTGLDTGARSNR